ncbi:MAG: hypothetical protein ACHQF0_00660 [Chitinophagales bacterium]
MKRKQFYIYRVDDNVTGRSTAIKLCCLPAGRQASHSSTFRAKLKQIT